MMVRGSWFALSSCLFAALVCLLAGCGLDNRGGDNNSLADGNRGARMLASFTEVVHPVLTASCGGCHGSTQPPTFALSAASSAWSVVESNGLMSALDPASSRVVIKGGTAHGGCTACNPTTAGTLRTAIEEWNRRVQAGAPADDDPSNPTVPTENRTVIASQNVTVPAEGAPAVVLNFNLDSVGVSAGQIRLRVSRFGTAVLLDRIQVVSGSGAIRIADVLPIANGTLASSSANWRSVKTVVGTSRTVTVSTDAVLLSVSNLTSLGLSILEIKPAAARTCQTASAFNTNVQPVINARCTGCHNTGGTGAGAMNLSANACESFLERAVPGAFSKSATIGMPRLQLFNHPVTNLTDGEAGRISTWYAGENPL